LKEEGIAGKDAQWKDLLFARAAKCKECEDGYIGRFGLQEVLTNTSTIKELLLRNSEIGAIEGQAREEGMLTLAEDGLFKAVQGLTSVEEVRLGAETEPK